MASAAPIAAGAGHLRHAGHVAVDVEVDLFEAIRARARRRDRERHADLFAGAVRRRCDRERGCRRAGGTEQRHDDVRLVLRRGVVLHADVRACVVLSGTDHTKRVTYAAAAGTAVQAVATARCVVVER